MASELNKVEASNLDSNDISSRIDDVDENTVTEFVTPDLEFDRFDTDLAATNVRDDVDNAIEEETPQEIPTLFAADDYETALGYLEPQDVAVQESLDQEYQDIARLRVIQVAGDDRVGRKVVVFSASRLPPFHEVNPQHLYEYIRRTLEQYVVNDYSLVYFHHGLTPANKPPLKWLVQAYRGFDRNFKKNLKALYIVHPTNFVQIIINVFKPIISRKFGQKIVFIKRLSELSGDMHLEQLPIPQSVKLYDAQLMSLRSPTSPNSNAAKVPPANLLVQSWNNDQRGTGQKTAPGPHQVFGVSLDFIMKNNNNDPIPRLLRDAVEHIRANCLDVDGIFRRCPTASLVKSVQAVYNTGGSVNFAAAGDPHLPAVLIKTFLRDLEEPLLTFDLYTPILSVQNLPWESRLESVREIISSRLPAPNYTVLQYLISFLTEVCAHSAQNRMTDVNLGIVFGPNLLWSRYATISSFSEIGQITGFAQLLISNYESIFVK